MSEKARIIVECSHCGAMYGVPQAQARERRRYRCQRCRNVFEGGFAPSAGNATEEQILRWLVQEERE